MPQKINSIGKEQCLQVVNGLEPICILQKFSTQSSCCIKVFCDAVWERFSLADPTQYIWHLFCHLSRHEPNSYARTQYFQNQFRGLIKPSSGRVSPPTAHHGVLDHSSQEIWRSETFVQVSHQSTR